MLVVHREAGAKESQGRCCRSGLVNYFPLQHTKYSIGTHLLFYHLSCCTQDTSDHETEVSWTWWLYPVIEGRNDRKIRHTMPKGQDPLNQGRSQHNQATIGQLFLVSKVLHCVWCCGSPNPAVCNYRVGRLPDMQGCPFARRNDLRGFHAPEGSDKRNIVQVYLAEF